ncbi:C4b-binding protein alpha chain isoform X2 [Hemicordylus capensis]|uniref:C4b-binding protein alpha chain isoform X2 n=1 Tax=Hemicordylus capensis TaxID=884348 RepID=UPI002304016F|nr:C4b-binding protein alpha chain isoform X2 [Hemicordylus capensis]
MRCQLRGSWWARPLLGTLALVVLPQGSLGQCAIKDLPKLPNSEPEKHSLPPIVPQYTAVVYICKPGFVKKSPQEDDRVICHLRVWMLISDPCIPGPTSRAPKTSSNTTRIPSPAPPTSSNTTRIPSPAPPTSSNTTRIPSPAPPTSSDTTRIPSPAPPTSSDTTRIPSPAPPHSSDFTMLIIPHGRITKGRKTLYKPGDSVTVECLPGYVLRGKSVIQYVGGNKWSPNVPSCFLRLKLP